MKYYKEISLGEDALNYIRYVLSNGHTLANLLLQRLDFSCGKVTTYLPEYVSEESIQKFEEGGKIKVSEKEIVHLSLQDKAGLRKMVLPKKLINVAKFVGQFHKTSAVKIEPVPNTDFWLISVIDSFLKAKSNGICILENTMSKPSDPWLLKRKSKIVLFDSEVYHFITSKKSQTKKIQNTIKEARGSYPPLICVMTTIDYQVKDGDKIDLEFLKLIVQRTEKIIIGAYDGEGYILWGKIH